MHIHDNSTGKIVFGVGAGGVMADSSYSMTTETFNDGSWHHVVAVHDSATKRERVYVDGIQRGLNPLFGSGGTTSGLDLDVTALTNQNATSSDDLVIGSYNINGQNVNGSLDEVRIYNRALSASEIQELDLSDSPRTITYDDNGNMLTNGTGQTYEWDAANRMTKISYAGSGSTEFTYDAMGRRVKIVEKNSGGTTTSTKQFVWCGMEMGEERNASNTVITRFFAQGEQVPAASSPDNKLFYTKDHLGSIRELVDNNQVVRGRWDYDPYGKRSANLITSGALETNFSYTGHSAHATSGLVLAPYRAYDSNLGRWLSRDPIAENGGINLYGYVGNNSFNGVDQLGLWTRGWGYQGSAGLGVGIGFSVGLFIGHRSDAGLFSGWSFDDLISVEGGFNAGWGASLGRFSQMTNAECVDDLKGLGIAAGGSLGTQYSVGVEYIRGVNDNMGPFQDGITPPLSLGDVEGVNVNWGISVGPLPAEGHVFGTGTFSLQDIF